MKMTLLDPPRHVANNRNSSSGDASQYCEFVVILLLIFVVIASVASALAIPSRLATSHTSNQGHGSHSSKVFLYQKTRFFFLSLLYFKNMKASFCVAYFQTVIVSYVWKLLTFSTGSIFPSWLHCNALWSEQRLTFCSLQLNTLSLLTLSSIFLSCLSVHPSDLKGSSAHLAPSFQFLSVINFISPLFARRDLLFSLCLCLAPPSFWRYLALHLPVADTWFTAC